MVETQEKAGFLINQKSSVLTPDQEVQHIGFLIDLKEGSLKVHKEKTKNLRKELGKLVTKKFLSKNGSNLGHIQVKMNRI